MQLNPKRKQQYLDGEVGLIYGTWNITALQQITKFVNGKEIYWNGYTTPESFKPLAWFFEEDVVIPDTPKTPLQTAIEKLKADESLDQYEVNKCITILESLLPEERETMCRFAVKYSIEEDYDAHTLFNRTFKR